MHCLLLNRDRVSRQGRGVGAVVLLGVLGLWTAGARADEPDPAVQAYAHRLAVGVCGTCHGPQGNSVQPKFPRLAGQNANYLVAQLKNFRGQSRGDPDAISYMWGMAGPLTDETIDALGKYYSTQRVVSERVADSAEIARGRDIYEKGVTSEGVPACAACHGPDAHGLADFPRLAGQHSQYVLKQLSSFQSNMRNVAVMHGVAQSLRLPEMRAVAAYVESLQ
jgi:cytochrome c553